jgi:hypothetical protein
MTQVDNTGHLKVQRFSHRSSADIECFAIDPKTKTQISDILACRRILGLIRCVVHQSINRIAKTM